MRSVGQVKSARLAGLRFSTGSLALSRAVAAILVAATIAAALQACGRGGGSGIKLGERVVPLGQPVPRGGGYYTIGQPYQIGGAWYTPREDPNYDRVGSASWYGELFHGRRTANGEIYDMDRISAAHPTLPLPVYARVTNLNNGRSIVVRINDRGPYARDRIIDLSRRSAELLGFRHRGTATVRVKYLGRAPLNGDDSYERRYLASQSWVQLAAKGGAAKSAVTEVAMQSIAADTLPAENPENLARHWTEARPSHALGPSASKNVSELSSPQTTASLPLKASAAAPATGPVIQAGSFKNKENAERARDVLGAIAPVEVAPVSVGDDVLYRVRVGPFATLPEAKAAMPKVERAGYRGAKLVRN